MTKFNHLCCALNRTFCLFQCQWARFILVNSRLCLSWIHWDWRNSFVWVVKSDEELRKEYLSRPLTLAIMRLRQIQFIGRVYYIYCVSFSQSFGPETKNIITLNLPEGKLPHAVQVLLSFSLYFTYPVMMFPVIRILEKRLIQDPGSQVVQGVSL